MIKYYLREAKQFLDLNWDENIFKNPDLKHQEIARLLGFKKYRPSLRMCKRNFGLTVERFFMHCRVAETKQFLAQPGNRNCSLRETFRQLGHPHQPNFNRQFRIVMDITVTEFRYFHEHFVKTTGMDLVEYEEPDLDYYMPESGKPNFLSNFLNEQRQKVLDNQNYYK